MRLPLLKACLKCFSGDGPQPGDSFLAQAHCISPPIIWDPRWHYLVYSPDLPPDIFQLFSKIGALPSRNMFRAFPTDSDMSQRELSRAVWYSGNSVD